MASEEHILAGKSQHRLLIVRPTLSIAASAALIAVLALHNAPGMAENGHAALPQLGNTADTDKIMVREITDDHIAKNDEPEPSITDKGSTSTAPISGSNLIPEEENASVWQRLRVANRLPRKKHERVDFYLEQYQREALWINKILNRGTPFMGYVVESLESRFMPIELALLPAIESGFQAHAKSSGNAAGIWQIVPITAREIGVERTDWFDGRGDIVRSTTAAIDYLSYLNAEFNGDWELTLAAYNAGPGRIRGAIKKNKKAGKPTDFWSLKLPEETTNYVPKILAMLEFIQDPETEGLTLPELETKAAFTEVDVGKRISLDQAAIVGNINEQLLQQLNGGLIHRVTPPSGPHRLLLPVEAVEQFMKAIEVTGDTRLYSLPQTHEVVAGDTISSIAKKYGISQRKLRELNSLDNSRILIGQKLGVIDVRGVGSTMVEYNVKIGDTLSEIAARYSVKIGAIRNASGQSPVDHIIHPGEKLTIVVGKDAG